jgi:hypothetical protein
MPASIVSGAPGVEEFYSGGSALDHADPRTAYCAVQVERERWDVLRCVTADRGMTWHASVLSSPGRNLRPVSVRGPGSPFRALSLSGTYSSDTSYSPRDLGIHGSPALIS